ncbi:uncharacterized protein M6B38_115985 [Iris pallida]|uniref:BSD domain-containing protein n=1 Tax=Iris pallida TaxID=29817 RepID=A0AAX6I4W8_IRIPA|nr:uncharacterized protein M6B38_115985 [Iris pallida]
MDIWQRARVFAEAAAKRSQELSKEAAKLSQEFVTETAKKSKELAVEASRKADQIKTEAIKRADQIQTEAIRRADQIRTLAADIEIPISIPPLADGGIPSATAPQGAAAADLETFGVTEELREFVKGITISTFRDFPMEDEPQMSEVPTVSNVRQDLNEWQAKHATLVLSTVKEISKFRYELCPRYMKERKFWRIYFILVNNYVIPYEKQYMENLKVEMVEQKKIDGNKESSASASTSASEVKGTKLQSKPSASSTTEQDLDVFLLGDLGSSDEGPDDGNDGFDDDFDKIGNNSDLESDDDNGSKPK